MRSLILFCSLCYFSVAITDLTAQEAATLLSSAIYEEEVNGDLENAIGIYTRIVDEYPDERPVAAEALWRLGISHEKLGLEKAQQYYQQLVSNYKDQPEFSNAARLRLQQMIPIIRKEEAPSLPDPLIELAKGQLKTSKVFTMPSIYGSISPNGKYISYTNWDNGNLAIYNRYTEESKDLSTDASWYSDDWCDKPIWSPDNKKIAYCWIVDNDAGTELRVYDLEEGSYETLTVLQEKAVIWPVEWTKDGSAILAALFDRKEGRQRIVMISAIDGSIKPVQLIPKGEECADCEWSISPDGQNIIYGKKLKNGKTELYIMSVDGTGDQPLIANPSRKRVAKWLGDNRSFLYYSDITGYNALWKANMDENFHVQNTELLLEGLTTDFITIGLTDEGTYYYVQTSYVGNISTIEFDADFGTFTRPQPVPSENPQPRFSSFWSPDASKLAYFRIHPLKPKVHYLEIRDMASGEETILDIDGEHIEGPLGTEGGACWSPDGTQLLLQRWEMQNDQSEIILVDSQTGGYKKVANGFNPKVFGKKDIVYYIGTDSIHLSIIEQNLITGDTNIIYSTTENAVNNLALSPDGRHLAFTQGVKEYPEKNNKLMLLSLESRTLISLWECDTGHYFIASSGLNWLHDNRRLLIAVADVKNSRQQLYLFDIETGLKQTLGDPVHGERNFMHTIRIHPTKNSFVFGIWQITSNIWALENY